MSAILRLEDLFALLAEKPNTLVVDVSNPEDFALAHLPQAQNACVFEVDFLDQFKALLPQTDENLATPIIVYGSSENSLASTTAAKKLRAAGFTAVSDFRGGLAEWRAAGRPVESDPAGSPVPGPIRDGNYTIDLEESVIEWTGRSLASKHTGTIDLVPGASLALSESRLVGGSFTLEMATIRDTDLADPAMRKILETHLKSDDFFDVENFPQAQFFIDSAETIDAAPLGAPNYTVKGRLKLKGVEKPLHFPAEIGRSTDDSRLVARAHFDIDRTEWNVLYGSGKFYEKLGKHLVNDCITLDLKIVARP